MSLIHPFFLLLLCLFMICDFLAPASSTYLAAGDVQTTKKVLHSSRSQALGGTTREGGFSGCAFPLLGSLIQQTHLLRRYYLKDS
jgi:hypothetical protein